MTRIWILSVALASLVAVVAASTGTAGPPAIELIRATIGGGGTTSGAAEGFQLSGTIGQPDAGLLTGGDLELNGGFWFALTPTDCNEDGSVDLLDYTSFIQCLAGPDGGVRPGCECLDADHTGSVDLRDYAVAQSAYTAS